MQTGRPASEAAAIEAAILRGCEWDNIPEAAYHLAHPIAMQRGWGGKTITKIDMLGLLDYIANEKD